MQLKVLRAEYAERRVLPCRPSVTRLGDDALRMCMFAGRRVAAERDAATSAAVALCVAGGADIVRVHNVAAGRDAACVADAVCRHQAAIA